MHPLTIYDIAIGEHRRATDQRLREHLLARRRRERTTVHLDPSTSSTAGPGTGAARATAEDRSASSVRPAAA